MIIAAEKILTVIKSIRARRVGINGYQMHRPKKWNPNYPTCPVYGKAKFLHHDREHDCNYRCCDKKCNHSFFVPKPTAISAPSIISNWCTCFSPLFQNMALQLIPALNFKAIAGAKKGPLS